MMRVGVDINGQEVLAFFEIVNKGQEGGPTSAHVYEWTETISGTSGRVAHFQEDGWATLLEIVACDFDANANYEEVTE